MNDSTNSPTLELSRVVPLSALMAALASFVYVSGYLTHSIYVRNRGILHVELVRSQYIESGLTFVALTAFLVGVPYLAISLTIAARRKAGTPIATPFVWVSPFINTNYLYAVLFFAVFITRPDWDHVAPFLVGEPRLATIATTYFIVQGVLLLVTPALRHLQVERSRIRVQPDVDRSVSSRGYRWAVNSLRTASLIVTLTFDYLLLHTLPWLPNFLRRAVYYILCVIVLSIAVRVLWGWLRTYSNSQFSLRLLFLGVPFFLSFYVIAATTYTFALYRNIPTSRGGRYPVAQAIFLVEPNSLTEAAGLLQNVAGSPIRTKPVYVVEENTHFIYILTEPVGNWFDELGPVHGLRRSDIISVNLLPLESGGPRWSEAQSR